jgi:glycerol-3-phosphate acyltransferase PlsX
VTEITVVIDGSGGAREGRAALEAAATASLDLDLYLAIVGDESDLTEALSTIAHDAERLRVVHALNEGSGSSVVAGGLHYAARTPGACFVSAGDPAEIVEAARAKLQPLVDCPSLAAVLPTLRHRGVHDDPLALLLDVGASARASVSDLVQFAIMGAAYSRLISKNDRPTVALLAHTKSVEAAPREIAGAADRLGELDAEFDFIGLIRANEIPLGAADVVVAEGLVGNVVIRTLEGVASTGEALLTRARSRFMGRVGVSILGGGIQRLRALADWENYGGAPLLGFDRTVIVTQDEADVNALVNSIRLAAKVERLGVRDVYSR